MEKDIYKFFLDECAIKKKEIENNNLLSSSIIDSLDLLKLTLFIEKKFKIKISPFEIVPQNFDTVEKIIKLIKSKQK